MAWLIGILKFICAFIGFASASLFVLSCISAIINPQLITKNGDVVEKNANSRYMFAFIMSIAWAILIALG